LREDFEATRQAEEQGRLQVATEVRAKIAGVRILNKDGDALHQISPGDDLRIAVDVEAANLLDDWVLGIGIDTPSGQNVYGTSTQLMGERMPSFSGSRTFELTLRNVWLGGGQYQLHGALAEWAGPEFHRLPQAASFSVQGDGRSIGLLGAAPEFVPA
jgi:ABC-2 type transport system ATP-binding protein